MTSNTAQTSSVSEAQIIQFPKPYRFNEGADGCPLELVSNVLEMKVGSAEMSLAFVADNLFNDIADAGIIVRDERLAQLLVANIRAIMYEHLGLEHPLHIFVERHLDEVDEILDKQDALLSLDELAED